MLGEIPGGNLRVYYKLEDVNDSSSNGFTLTNTGSVPFNAGKYNKGADFGTSGDKVLIRNSNILSTGIPSSIFQSFYFKLNSTTNISDRFMIALVSGASSSVGQLIQCFYSISSGTLTFKTRYGVTGAGVTQTWTEAANTTKWHRVSIHKNTSTSLAVEFNDQATKFCNLGAYSGAVVGFGIGNGLALTVPAYVIIDQVIVDEGIYATNISNRLKLKTNQKFGTLAI